MRVLCNALFAVSVCAAPLWAEEPVRIYVPAQGYASGIGRTFVEIRESDEPGASAEVEFMNRPINNGAHTGGYSLTWERMTIRFRFQWNAGPGGADEVSIEPPPGYSCWPACEILVDEGSSGVVLIYPAMS